MQLTARYRNRGRDVRQSDAHHYRLATDGNEINLSLITTNSDQRVQLESPDVAGMEKILPAICEDMHKLLSPLI